MARSLWAFAIAGIASLYPQGSPCLAEEAGQAAPRFETYMGADYGGRSASISSRLIWSAFGPVTEPGFRLKLDGLSNVFGDTNAGVFSSGFLAADIKAMGDVMAGYQMNRGPYWIKFYAGAAYQSQARIVWEAGQAVTQQNWGGAAAIEAFWRNGRIWAATNVSWLQMDNNASIYSRLAYDILRGGPAGLNLSIGAEAAAATNNANVFKEGARLDLYNDYVRAGALINLRYGAHDFSLSGGLSETGGEGMRRPFISLSYGKKF